VACIFFVPWPFPSHGTASLKLARTLRSDGHDVVYVSIGKEDPRYAAHGFRSLVILQDVLPEGPLGVFQRYSGWRLEWAIRRGLPGFIDGLDRELPPLIGQHRPALAIVDRMLPYVPLFFHRDGVPSALFFTVLPFEFDATLGPPSSGLPPPRTTPERVRSWLHWRLYLVGQRQAMRRLGLHRMYPRLAARCNFPLEKLKVNRFAEYLPQVAELIACDASFDVPRTPKPQRFYLGPCIDLERAEPAFDWSLLDERRKLAYCSLGSQPHTYADAAGFFLKVREAFAGVPGWQAVISAGDLYEPLVRRMTGPAPNVVVVKDAPQLSLLRRAAVMLTHGGLGSIKESLYFGVPLVVCPASGDQISNGARVARYGIGLVGSLRRSTGAEIRRLVLEVSASAAIRSRVDAMRTQFVNSQHNPPILAAAAQIIAEGVAGDYAGRTAPVDHGSAEALPRERGSGRLGVGSE
jgi:zeaxanthin glucosyltransferase